MIQVVSHFPVLIVVISILSSITIFLAGWINKQTSWWISAATILGQFVASLFILHHVLTQGPIIYRLVGGCHPGVLSMSWMA